MNALLLVVLVAAAACGGTKIVENRPNYEVSGLVRTAGGTPLSHVLVEMRLMPTSVCGPNSSAASYSSGKTNGSGHYVVYQDEWTGVLDGCMRLTVHPDSMTTSAPLAVVDTVIHSLPVSGRTSIDIDLTVP